ncbi:MAG: FmdB family zinc ribbon protein [Candidatus Margulisiibacteriota bacterium]
MPLYDYKCTECAHIFEVQQKLSEEPLKFCPICKGPIKRLISAAGIVFKGSGFYVTDSAKKKSHSSPAPKVAPSKEVKPSTVPTENKSSTSSEPSKPATTDKPAKKEA